MQLATAWINLGQVEPARALLAVLETRFLGLPNNDTSAANHLMRLARLRLRLGDAGIAERNARAAVDRARTRTPPDALVEATCNSVGAVARWRGGGVRSAVLAELDSALAVMGKEAPEDADTMWAQAQRNVIGADCQAMGDHLPAVLERLRALPITQDAGRRTLQELAKDAAAAFSTCGDSAQAAQFALMARNPPVP